YTIVHRPRTLTFMDDVPFVLAVIELAEGPHMLSNVVGCAPSDVHIDMPVVVQFEDATDEITLYKFRPAE
ncbi:MAG: OB-fold domain-containing protein, partial [Chloroflexi bacterium]|nr:OB-fold domain-containing protein [Chloroflexota bacterium]